MEIKPNFFTWIATDGMIYFAWILQGRYDTINSEEDGFQTDLANRSRALLNQCLEKSEELKAKGEGIALLRNYNLAYAEAMDLLTWSPSQFKESENDVDRLDYTIFLTYQWHILFLYGMWYLYDSKSPKNSGYQRTWMQE
uniref:DUF4760 domain-containing protein n=1 Tax=Angiostrongylus cantonensis TaxID=6313 RepID=A0A158P7F2_ANGCA